MRAMLGDDKRTRLGKIVHLTRRVMERHAGRQRAAASRTDRRIMLNDRVGTGQVPESLALVAFLPAGLFAGRHAQARHPRWLSQPVARRRLAAAGAVQAETALKFRDTRHQRGDLRRLRLNQCNQFFPGRNIWRFSDHPGLESETGSPVQKNPLKIVAPANNLGSYR